MSGHSGGSSSSDSSDSTGHLEASSSKGESRSLADEQLDSSRSFGTSEGTDTSPARSTTALGQVESVEDSEDLNSSSDDTHARMRYTISQKMKDETVYCTNDDFLEYYLPPVPDTVDIDEVVEDLLARKYLLEDSESGKEDIHRRIVLKGISVKPSEEKERQADGKAVVCAPLVDLAAAIRRSVGAPQNTFSLRVASDRTLSSSISGSLFKIDACMTANSGASGDLGATDIVVPFEVQLRNDHKKRQKNRRHLATSVVLIMNEDLRRNHVYAVTIEDVRLSMWYFSRTHTVKATSFSIVKDPVRLVRILASLSCASEEQLGYDARITLLPDRSFLYEFPAAIPPTAEGDSPREAERQPVYFRTSEAIVEARAYHVAGKVTRIFKCKRVVSKEDPTPVPGTEDVVVKDVWIGVDHQTEFQIQQRLFRDIENLRTEYPDGLATHYIMGNFQPHEVSEWDSWLQDDRYKDLFLCVDRESVGPASKAVHPKAWDSDDIFAPEEPSSGASCSGTGDRTTLPVSPAAAPPTQTHLGSAAYIPSSRRCFNSKKRCFYTFEQVCTRVSDLPTLGDAIDVLRHSYLALMLMFCAGWVHCDISHGNILASTEDGGESWQGRLSDLECARRFPSEDAGSTDPKTGTLFFMAYEIRSSRSLYNPKNAFQNGFHGRNGKANRRKKGHTLRVVKKHTYAHDLESLWWLLLWIITNLFAHNDSYSMAHIYFELNDLQSRLALLREGALPITDPRVDSFKEPLDTVRETLFTGYERRNPEEEMEDCATYQGACVDFYDFFAEVKKSEATWGSIALRDPSSRYTQRVALASISRQTVISVPQVTTNAQSGPRKRKALDEDEPAINRSALRDSFTAPEHRDSKGGGSGPPKRPRT